MTRVGLSGYGDIATGLGQLNRRFWHKLPFAVRHVQQHQKFGHGPASTERSWAYSHHFSQFLKESDVLVFVERPFPNDAVERFKEAGKRVVCLPMCEWTPATLPWLPLVDKFIATTNQCEEWMALLGCGSKTVRLQCPLDLDEFPFRERTTIGSVVYLDGWGGENERKGWKSVQEMLKSHPGLVRVKSQRKLPGSEPAADNPVGLYADADCILMPARYDGLGLTALEAMASGCVVLATDAPPCGEFLRAACGENSQAMLLPVKDASQVRVWSHAWTAANVDVQAMGQAVNRVKAATGGEIARLSRAGRAYIEREHGDAAWEKLWGAITSA